MLNRSLLIKALSLLRTERIVMFFAWFLIDHDILSMVTVYIFCSSLRSILPR